MNSVSLAFSSFGTGKPILMAGSLGSTRAMWDPQVSDLGEHVRIITIDHRGHGDSPTPLGPYTIDELGMDTLRLMDALDLELASFVGLSLGGMVGMWLAANAPDRIDQLVVMCSSAHMSDAGPWLERARASRSDGPASIANLVVSRWLTPAFAANHPETENALVQMVAETSAEGYAGCCEAIAAMDLRDGLAQIVAPTLVIAAGQDASTPADTAVKPIADAIPNAEFVVIDDAAHLVNVQQPARVSGLLREFLLN